MSEHPAPVAADRERAAHELKVWPPFFDALADGSKMFEVRKDDRDIQPGDLLRLREFVPHELTVRVGTYTGREVTRRVGFVLRGDDAIEFGIEGGYCVLSLAALTSPAPAPSDELRVLSEAATPGPWGHGGAGVATAYFDGREERVICKDTLASDQAYEEGRMADWMPEMRQDAANGRFIAAAVNHVRAALAAQPSEGER